MAERSEHFFLLPGFLLSGVSACFTVVAGFAFSGYAIGIVDYLGVIILRESGYGSSGGRSGIAYFIQYL